MKSIDEDQIKKIAVTSPASSFPAEPRNKERVSLLPLIFLSNFTTFPKRIYQHF